MMCCDHLWHQEFKNHYRLGSIGICASTALAINNYIFPHSVFVCMSWIIFQVTSNYFPKEHIPIGLNNGRAVCSL
jgi:hypothetical protein